MSATHADLWCICNEKMNCFVVDFFLLLHLQMWIRWQKPLTVVAINLQIFVFGSWKGSVNIWEAFYYLKFKGSVILSPAFIDFYSIFVLFLSWMLLVWTPSSPLSVPLPPHSRRTSNWGVKGAICYLLKHTTAVTGVFTPRVHLSVTCFC